MIHVQLVTNKKHLVTQIIVTLSGLVNTTEAQSPATYRLATAGKKNSFDAKNAKLIKLKSAVVQRRQEHGNAHPEKALRTNQTSPAPHQRPAPLGPARHHRPPDRRRP